MLPDFKSFLGLLPVLPRAQADYFQALWKAMSLCNRLKKKITHLVEKFAISISISQFRGESPFIYTIFMF